MFNLQVQDLHRDVKPGPDREGSSGGCRGNKNSDKLHVVHSEPSLPPPPGVARCRLSSASPVVQVVRVGGNASVTCNLTSSSEITWFLLRSDQLLPLLTVRPSKLRGHSVEGHAADTSRLSAEGDVDQGPLSLEVTQVEEEDAGLYFCTGRCSGTVCVNRGVDLSVTGECSGSSEQVKVYECSNLHCNVQGHCESRDAFTRSFSVGWTENTKLLQLLKT